MRNKSTQSFYIYMLNNNKIKRVRSALTFTNHTKQNPQTQKKFKLSFRTIESSPKKTLSEIRNSNLQALSQIKDDRKLTSDLINKWLVHDNQEKMIIAQMEGRPSYSSSSWRAIHSARSQQKLCKLNKQNSSTAIKMNLTEKISRIKTKHVQKQLKFNEQIVNRKDKQQHRKIQTIQICLKLKPSQLRKDIDGILNKWQKQYVHLKERYTQRLKKGYKNVQLSETCNKKWQEWFMIYQ